MRISKRNTYLIGAAAVIAGIALIVIALVVVSDDGGGGPPGDSASTNPRTAPAEPTDGEALPDQVRRRKAVRAPGFSLPLIHKGTPPTQARAPLRESSRSGRLDSAALNGTPVVLHVWSSDCAPCRADARLVQATWERWGRRGVVFVGLSIDGGAQDALRFARQYGLTYPVIHDRSARTAKAYGVRRLPETFFISSGGNVVGHVVGSPSVRQMEFGAGAARSARPIGSEQGASSVPLG